MRHVSIGMAGLALAGVLAAGPVMAQPAPGLNYVQPLNSAAVTQVQERLRQTGAYAGRADGVWGPDSQSALERFQQRNGLQVTGTLNQATAATLGLNPGELLAGPGAPASAAQEAGPGALAPALARPGSARHIGREEKGGG